MTDPTYNLEELWRVTRCALLVTASFPGEDGKPERLSDTARRLALLIGELSLGEKRSHVWIESDGKLAKALSIDKGDLSKARAKLIKLALLHREPCDGGYSYALKTAQLVLRERNLEAASAFVGMRAMAAGRPGPLLIPPDPETERRDAGMEPALCAVDHENTLSGAQAAGVSVVGKVPTRRLGDNQPGVGNIPTRSWGNPNAENGRDLYARTRAPGDSGTDRQISIRSNRELLAPAGPDRRFRDGEKNWILEELRTLDTRNELAEEICRRTWLGRIRDFASEVREAIAEVKHEIRTGKNISSPLGRVFTKARDYARAVGKKIHLLA